MNKLTITAIFLSISVASTAAYACMGGGDHKCNKHQGQKQFSLMDANADGSLSKEEVISFHEQHFISMDANADGLVTKEEMKMYKKKQHFKHMDSNKDGVISESEMMKPSALHKKNSHCSNNNRGE